MVDTHCHLDVCEPPDSELLDRALGAGVTRVATVGMNDASIERALRAAHAHDSVAAIVGRHPHEAEGFGDDDLARIERAAADREVRAIGETGLDYFRDRAPRADQRRAFERQLELANRLELPLVVHTREAADDTLALLRDANTTVILHCFSIPERLDEAVERRYMCSFAGNVTYPKATALQAAARDVPEELLLVETDSPFLSPQPVRGRPNEPANVVATARHVAKLRGVPYEALERIVDRNAARVFRW